MHVLSCQKASCQDLRGFGPRCKQGARGDLRTLLPAPGDNLLILRLINHVVYAGFVLQQIATLVFPLRVFDPQPRGIASVCARTS